MTGLRITACLGLIVWTTLTSSAQSAPSSAPSTSATSAREAPQGPAAPDTPAYSTAPAQDGSTGDGMIAPDTRPLSGAQPFTLGISGQKQMVISLQASQLWDSNPSVASNAGANFEGVTSGGGSLSLQRQLQNSQTQLSYSGDVLHYSTSQPSISTFQNLNFSQNFKFGRWGLGMADTFTYVPNSLLGGGYMLPIPDLNSTVIKSNFVPDQSILNPYGAQYTNTVMGQLEYGLSRRAAWSASGTYGLVKFRDFGLYDFNQVSGTTGYNYSVTAKDTIAVTYLYSLYRYQNFNSEFHSQAVQFSYGRKITGRMAFQAAGGPQFVSSGGLTAAANRIAYSGNASFSYQRARTSFALGYSTGTTAGAGVLFGAMTSTAQFTASRSLTKTFSGEGVFGYSRSSDLSNTALVYQSLFAGANVHRTLGRYAGLSFSYNYQRQISDNCTGLVCGDVNRNIAGVSFNWSFRPIRLE